MNPAPRLRYRGFDGDPRPEPCGKTAQENRQRYFLASAFDLDFSHALNIAQAARRIRRTWPRHVG